ncbi:hypothetical protein [Natrononativus amylolyticus]|uniref:hypothetical protein n=1 Tax=Natrononativus amylolyticus TaxID=2963434 RepID=UPI0020CC9D12|nr:hypothetical protein [Natrononativus amylolyticus]
MDEDLPVEPVDVLILVVVSVVGGVGLASLTLAPAPTPNFAVAVLSGTVLLAFFLFIPVMGVRLLLEERKETDQNA